jgi:hypothetical protein
MIKDIFLCHHHKDKERLARPFYQALQEDDLDVWFDEAEIQLGDSIISKIQEGLSSSKFLVVLITDNFLNAARGLRFEELNAAIARQARSSQTLVMPILHDVDHSELERRLPLLADRQYELAQDPAPWNTISKKIAIRVLQKTRPLMLDRSSLDHEIGSMETRIDNARETLCISGNDNKFAAESLSAYINLALERGVKIKLLFVDPDSAAADMLPQIDPRFPTAQSFRDSVKSVMGALNTMRQNKNLEIRFLPILPAMGFFITDPETSWSTVKVEIYTAKPWGEGKLNTRPHIILNENMGDWKKYFLDQWTNYWNLARMVK